MRFCGRKTIDAIRQPRQGSIMKNGVNAADVRPFFADQKFLLLWRVALEIDCDIGSPADSGGATDAAHAPREESTLPGFRRIGCIFDDAMIKIQRGLPPRTSLSRSNFGINQSAPAVFVDISNCVLFARYRSDA